MAAITSVALAATLAAASMSWTTANSVATGDQDTAAIAANRNGHVAVVWEDDRDTAAPENANHSDVWLRLFQNGVAKYELKLSAGGTSGTNWRHVSPDVGLDDKGNAVVVWAEDADGNGVFNIAYRVVAPAGSVLASGRANADTAGDQLVPKVGVDPDGAPNSTSAVAFSVVWEDIQGTVRTVRAAGYTAAATKAYEVTASQTAGTHQRPDVAVSASGDATVVWDEDADGNGFFNVGLVRLAKANGAVNLSRRSANSLGDGQQRHPSISAGFDQSFAVAWESDHTGTGGTWTRSFAADGTPRHVEAPAANGAANPSIGIDDQGNTVVGWTAGADVSVRGFNPDGSTAGRLAPQVLSQTATGRQEQLVVAVSPWGEVSVAYTDDNDGNTFDQVILGTGGANSDW